MSHSHAALGTSAHVAGFVGGTHGRWEVDSLTAVTGSPLARTARLAIVDGRATLPAGWAWVLRGTTSNTRYTHRAEQERLSARQPSLGRPAATRAALIPIRKSPAWWELAQDERRAVFESRSQHIATGLGYLPAIARRLYHCRDLGEEFDFLTWFEYADTDADRFETLVGELRETEEWSYVEREVDIRLRRQGA